MGPIRSNFRRSFPRLRADCSPLVLTALSSQMSDFVSQLRLKLQVTEEGRESWICCRRGLAAVSGISRHSRPRRRVGHFSDQRSPSGAGQPVAHARSVAPSQAKRSRLMRTSGSPRPTPLVMSTGWLTYRHLLMTKRPLGWSIFLDMPHLIKDMITETAKNIAMRNPSLGRQRLLRPRTSEKAFAGQSDQLQRFAFQALDAIRSAGVDVGGKRILEIGPGDFLTSGMALLAAGAAHYASIDRFVGDYSTVGGKDWYAGIERAWPDRYPEISWPTWLHAEDFPEAYIPYRVSPIDAAIENLIDLDTCDVVDVLCSFQVAEHISDMDAFANAHRKLLKPGGIAVHRVDFGPHGVWRGYRDPLTFLRFSDRVWAAMGSARGAPNRFRVHEVVASLERTGFSVVLLNVSSQKNEVDMKRLNRRFQQMPIDSVLTDSATVVVTW